MMTATPTMFDAQAASRRTDPPTSGAAAERVTKSGKAATQREQILTALREHPGTTAAEIAALSGMERHDPSRRLPELRKAGLVTNGRERVCDVTGFASLTWWPVPSGSEMPPTITPRMIEQIHAAIDYHAPSGEQILLNHARARARRTLDAITAGAFQDGVGRTTLARAGNDPHAAGAQAAAAAVRVPLRGHRANRGRS